MNTNDDRNESELDVHAMLTALVLGELEPDAAAQWNERCANEPELLAQKERIDATIGALKSALPVGGALSHDMLTTLGKAAAVGPARPVSRFSWRLAIAAGTVIGLGFGFAKFGDDDSIKPPAQRTAGLREGDVEPTRAKAPRELTPPVDAPVPDKAGGKAADGAELASEMTEIVEEVVTDKVKFVGGTSSPTVVEPKVPTAEPKQQPSPDPAHSVMTLTTGGSKDDSKVQPVAPTSAELTLPLITQPSDSVPAAATPLPAPTAPKAEGKAYGDRRGSGAKKGATPEKDKAAGPATGLLAGSVRQQALGGGRGPTTSGGGPVVPGAKNRGESKDDATKEAMRLLSQSGYIAADEFKKREAELRDGVLDGYEAIGGFAVLSDFETDEDKGNGFAQLPPAERARLIVESCRPRPRELPRDMFFRWYGDHAFERSALERLSTFSIDVDTASYPLVRNYLDRGQIPPKDAVRTEEFVNYFKPDLGAPQDGSPFSIWLEASPSPFGGTDRARWLLRVGVRAKDVAKSERQPLRLAFVVDNSGSMQQENRLELVKYGLRLLVSQLDPRDKIAIVRFASDASVLLQWTHASERATIEAAIHGMRPDGSTNAEAGLKLGYELAVSGLDAEAVNRVVILSDGVANTGQTDQDRICADVKDKRQRGIYLNAIGVGMGNHNDTFLERLADQGDGICSYIDDEAEAKRALVDRFIQQTMTIARDVKIQLEFDPAQVDRWRQLGYENRAIADADFRNDAVDAGEVGAGHQIVALYEIEPVGDLTQTDGPFATIRIRYKQPFVAGANAQNETAQEIAATIPANAVRAKFDEASAGFQKSALVAQFAEFLRRSIHARGDSLDDLLSKCVALAQSSPDAEFTEFTKLVDKSRSLILQNLPRYDELTQAVDALRRNQLLTSELTALAQNQATDVLKQLEAQNRKLEDEIRRLIEQRIK